jgi:hypothetical protein
MNPFNKLPGFQRTPAGLEWVLLRRLPWIAVAGTAAAILCALWAHLGPGGAGDADAAKFVTTVDIVLVSLVILHWTVVLTVAIGCIIVWIAKGPAYVADAYPLSDADAPVAGPRDYPSRSIR